MTSFESAGLPARVIHVETIGSTNQEGLNRARLGERGPLWLRADVQTSGRGRLGRDWASPKGNLHATLLLHDPAPMRVLPQLAHVAAVALAEAVQRTVGSGARFVLKWPNDLLFGGAKVAGILVEGTRDPEGRSACVIGFGVNCRFHPEGLPYPATDLSTVADRIVSADALFRVLRSSVAEAVALWDQGRGYAAIRETWLHSSIPVGTPLVVRANPVEIQGLFDGIDLQGRLLVRTPTGVAAIEAGDVFLDDRSAANIG